MRLRLPPVALSLAMAGSLALPVQAGHQAVVQGGFQSFSNLPITQGCSANDLTGVSVASCHGFMQGNLLKGGSGDLVSDTVAAALGMLGMVGASQATYIEKIASNNGSLVVDFSAPLTGTTYLGLHLGGGSNAFTDKMRGGGTAFYRFEAGTQLDSFLLASNLTASSGVALFGASTTPLPRLGLQRVSSVPEPQSLALLLTALAGMGLARRLRRR